MPMDRFHSLLPLAIALAWCALPAPAAASPGDAPAASNALVVVVEAPAALLDPTGLRRTLGVQLARPCVSLLDAQAPTAAGVLSVVLDNNGHGRIELHPRGGVASYVAIERPRRATRAGAWLSAAAGQLVDAGMSTPERRYAICREVLDPWPPTSVAASRAARLELPSEVLDPFATSAAQAQPNHTTATPGVISEVLDPWAGDPPTSIAGERAGRLSQPRPSVRSPRR